MKPVRNIVFSRNRSKRLDIDPKCGKIQKRFLLADKRECFI